MKKSNYKLPGLPGISLPKTTTTKTTPARMPGISKTGGFTSGADQSVNFGRASRAATRNPNSTSTFSNLLSSTTSNGLSGTLSNAVGLGGIGSLVSALTGVFGGKTAPPALVAYQLPASQQQTISTGSSSSIVGVYGGPSSAASFESHNNQIVQTVKQALLNSSSLNDVIAGL